MASVIDRRRAVEVTRTRLRLSAGAHRIEIGAALRGALEGAINARELIEQAQETLWAQPYRDNTAEERAAREYHIELVAWQLNRAADIAEKRLERLEAIMTRDDAEAELAKCADGVEGTVHWFEYYAWGYDPREDSPLAVLPFGLFPFQQRYVEWLESLVFSRRASGLVEKARDMGATVGAINLFDDTIDTVRGLATLWGPSVAPKTKDERAEDAIPAHLRAEHVEQMTQGRRLARDLALAEERKKIEQEDVGDFASFWDDLA
jgi:hypothetical protein